jgi:hypothetical protein
VLGLERNRQLGDGSKLDRLAPTPVPGLTGVVSIVAGARTRARCGSTASSFAGATPRRASWATTIPGPGLHPDVTSPQVVPASAASLR